MGWEVVAKATTATTATTGNTRRRWIAVMSAGLVGAAAIASMVGDAVPQTNRPSLAARDLTVRARDLRAKNGRTMHHDLSDRWDAMTSPAHYTELYDGTSSSRFDPVSEDATPYYPQSSKSSVYHVARLSGADTDGSYQLCGRPEVKHDGKWGSLCFRGFTQTDAQMFCKTMGLAGGTARYNDGSKPTWDDTVITHGDLSSHIDQRSPYGQGTPSVAPLQPDVPLIWMSEIQCAGDESNILDCPFGGKPGEGTIPEDKKQTWVDYARLSGSECDASSQVGLCCDTSQFCPPRSSYNPDGHTDDHEGQMFSKTMKPQQWGVEMVANCACDEGFYMVASSVYAGRCTSCPPGSCSPVGSTSIDDCYCLEGYYKNAAGDCAKCPVNSCSKKGATDISQCKCFEGFYLNGGECIACPEGTTSREGSTSEGQCNMLCGLPHSSEAGDNAIVVEAATKDVAAADKLMKTALIPYIQAVNDEKAAVNALATANAFVPPSPPAWASVHVSSSQTSKTSRGNRATHYLDRQSVNCGGYPLQQFLLRTPGNKIRYKFRCAQNLDFLGPENRQTSVEDDGDGRLIYLDRLNVKCGSDEALSYFHYSRRNGGHDAVYEYYCMKPRQGAVTSCDVRHTGLNDKGSGNDGRRIEYLDRHDVSCHNNEVLQSFKLQTINGQIRYKYRCCRVTGEADLAFQTNKNQKIQENQREITRQQHLIDVAKEVQGTSKALYEEHAAKRSTAVTLLKQALAVSTEEEANTHFESAQNRCQPRLMCLQSWCDRRARTRPCEPWPQCYPAPCHPWPACSKKLPAGGFENARLQPLTPEERAKEEISDVLKSYDAAAGFLSDSSAGKVAEQVEAQSDTAFKGEFDQR